MSVHVPMDADDFAVEYGFPPQDMLQGGGILYLPPPCPYCIVPAAHPVMSLLRHRVGDTNMENALCADGQHRVGIETCVAAAKNVAAGVKHSPAVQVPEQVQQQCRDCSKNTVPLQDCNYIDMKKMRAMESCLMNCIM